MTLSLHRHHMTDNTDSFHCCSTPSVLNSRPRDVSARVPNTLWDCVLIHRHLLFFHSPQVCPPCEVISQFQKDVPGAFLGLVLADKLMLSVCQMWCQAAQHATSIPLDNSCSHRVFCLFF